MLAANKKQRGLVLSVIASLLSLIFLAFGIRKRNTSLAAAKEWVFKYFGERFIADDDYLDDDLDFNHTLSPKFLITKDSSRIKLQWNNDGSSYYVVYISKNPFSVNFKAKKSFPSLCQAAANVKDFEYNYDQIYQYTFSTEWTRKILVEAEGEHAGKRSVNLLNGNFHVVVGSSAGNWSSYMSYPSTQKEPIVDILHDLKISYEKKSHYYKIHLLFGSNYKNLPFTGGHFLVKGSVDEIYTYKVKEISECVTIKLKNSNGGLCYFHYFNDFDEPVIKFVEYLPPTYSFENNAWYDEFLNTD